jgi:cytochrome c551
MIFRIASLLVLVLLLSNSCGQKSKKGGLNRIKDLKTKQYAIEGQQLYIRHCANCHQEDGSGLGRLIPPLAQADYMLDDLERTVRVIRHGLSGEIVVNGVQYNQPMPPNPKLTPIEIAQITTYIYNVFGEEETFIGAEEVRGILSR